METSEPMGSGRGGEWEVLNFCVIISPVKMCIHTIKPERQREHLFYQVNIIHIMSDNHFCTIQ